MEASTRLDSTCHSEEIARLCEDLIIDIPENLQDFKRPEVCIYKVPPMLRKMNIDAYSPQVISIGPIHHGNPTLEAMETYKRRYLKEFCTRSTTRNMTESEVMCGLLRIIKESEEKIRHCYSEPDSRTPSDKFVKMILLDSVFILELFLRHGKSSEYQKDHILGSFWLRSAAQQDLILLENQLPYFILDKLYDFATANFAVGDLAVDDEIYSPLLILTRNYFSSYIPDPYVHDLYDLVNMGIVLHFTDLVRRFWSFGSPQRRRYNRSISSATKLREAGVKYYNRSIPSATKLQEAGVKLKLLRNDYLLAVKCDKRDSSLNPSLFSCFNCRWRVKLQIPCLEINGSSDCLIRNLMAYEQCHYPGDGNICSYIKLLHYLVDNEKDVDLLVENGIISNRLGDSNSVVNLISNLGLQITEDESCYSTIYVQLNKHYRSSCNRRMAYLRNVYFGNLWGGTATVAAILLLLLTLIQAICSILQVVQQQNGSL